MTTIPQDLIPLHQVAKPLHLQTIKLARMSAEGEFPKVYRFGRSRWVSESEAAEWLEQQTEEVLTAKDIARINRAVRVSRAASRSRLALPSPDGSTASTSRGSDAR